MARAFRPMIMQDIVNKICPGGWCRGRGGGGRNSGTKRSFFFFFFSSVVDQRRATKSVVKAVIKALLLTCRSRGFLLAHGEGQDRLARPGHCFQRVDKMFCCKVRVLERDRPM